MRLREATVDDVPRLVELWAEFMDHHRAGDPFYTRAPGAEEAWAAFVRDGLGGEDWLVVVGEEGGEVVGYCLAQILERPPIVANRWYGFVQDLAVTATHRDRGVGSALFERVETWFAARGVDRIELNVSAYNETARTFWRRKGFGDYLERLAKPLDV